MHCISSPDLPVMGNLVPLFYFPTERDFPTSFESLVKKIHRLLLHVLAHLYHAHFREMVLLQLHGHLHSLFAHFTLFNYQFSLVDPKDAEVLQDLAVALGLCPPSPADGGLPSPATVEDDNSGSTLGESTETTTAEMPPTLVSDGGLPMAGDSAVPCGGAQ